MGKYAADTTVPPDRSLAEIRAVVARYGATDFTFGERPDRILLGFRLGDRLVRLDVPLPPVERFLWTGGKPWHGRQRNGAAQRNAHAADVRRLWRVLLLWLKAKLEAADDDAGLTSPEKEFLAWTVLPSGETTWERWNPLIDRALAAGEMPTDLLMLPEGRR